MGSAGRPDKSGEDIIITDAKARKPPTMVWDEKANDVSPRWLAGQKEKDWINETGHRSLPKNRVGAEVGSEGEESDEMSSCKVEE